MQQSINILRKNIYKFFFLKLNILFNNQVVYLHIPRTLGTKLQKETLENKIYNRIITLPHKYTLSKLLNNKISNDVFIIIREPIKWYFSYYSYKIKSKKNNINKNKSFSNFYNEIINAMKYKLNIVSWHHPFEKNSVVDEIMSIKNDNIGFYTKMVIVYISKNRKCYYKKKLSDKDITNIFYDFRLENIIKIENVKLINQKFLKNSKNKIDFDYKINHNPDNKSGSIEKIPDNIIKSIMYYDRIIYDLFYK